MNKANKAKTVALMTRLNLIQDELREIRDIERKPAAALALDDAVDNLTNCLDRIDSAVNC